MNTRCYRIRHLVPSNVEIIAYTRYFTDTVILDGLLQTGNMRLLAEYRLYTSSPQ
jgi:hypothetical protein